VNATLRGQGPVRCRAIALDFCGAFHAGLPAAGGAAAGAFTTAGGFRDGTVDGQVLQHEVGHTVMGLPGDLLQFPEDPGPDQLAAPFPDRGGRAGAVGGRRMLAAEPQDLISFPTMIRSLIRGLWHPSGCDGSLTGRSGSSAAGLKAVPAAAAAPPGSLM
jgi:hypothetical protein